MNSTQPEFQINYQQEGNKNDFSIPVAGNHTGNGNFEVNYISSGQQSKLRSLMASHYYHLSREMMRRAFTRTRDEEASQELVHKALMRALERDGREEWIPGGKNELNALSAYLCRIVEKLFLDDVRRIKRRRTVSMPFIHPDKLTDDTRKIEHALTYEQAMQELKDIAGEVPHKIIVLLSHGQSHQEIADAVGVSIFKVRNCIYSSRTLLRKWME